MLSGQEESVVQDMNLEWQAEAGILEGLMGFGNVFRFNSIINGKCSEDILTRFTF